MDKERIERLLEKFNAGEVSDAELLQIETLIADGAIALDDIPDLSLLDRQVSQMSPPLPSISLDKRFYEMLSAGEKKQARRLWLPSFTWSQLAPKMALASLMLVIGLGAGYMLRGGEAGDGHKQIAVLSQQVADLQEMMMLSLLEKGTTTERLKAVGLTRDMDDASKKVTNALIQTLNQDDNINVRLAALDALKAYSADNSVREALIRAIEQQNSPLVQIALAELMVAIQEKSAVKEFEKIIQSEKTPQEVKKKIQESIQTLI